MRGGGGVKSIPKNTKVANIKETVKNNKLNFRIQSFRVGMQPAGRPYVVIFRNQNVKSLIWGAY